MQTIRKIVSRENFKNLEIPKEFGDKFEMILFPIENGEAGRIENGKLRMENENKKENELFLASIYDAVIEDSDKEDKTWSKYL